MRLAPQAAARPLGFGVVAAEAFVGLALLSGAAAGLWSGMFVLALFTVALAVATARGAKGDCGCFGRSIPSQIGWTAVARNLVLLLLMAGAMWAGG